jgi:hypothetical protein
LRITIININLRSQPEGGDMGIKAPLTAVVLFFFLAAQAFSQGYMGTVTTGTGIVPPLTVGSGAIEGATVGAVAQSANLSGGLSIDLKGQSSEHLDLRVFQSQDLITGKGLMTAGSTSQSVIVAGSLAGERSILFVSPLDGGEVIRLQLSLSGAELTGGYDVLTQEGSRWSGTASGSIVFASGQKQATVVGRAANEKAYSGAFVGRSVPGQNEQRGASPITRNVSVYEIASGQGVTTPQETTVTSGESTVTSSY